MEEKINIAEILKDNPVGLKLYSPTFGCIRFNGVYKDKVYFYSEDTNAHSVNQYGKMYDGGECIIFPSKEMRDWAKFSWKKGDVMVTENGAAHIIFEKFTDDTYTIFAGKYYYCKNGAKGYTFLRECDNAITEEFTLETEDAAKTYISISEERLCGKLNRETLEVEKTQPEFKDGDVVALDTRYIDSDDVIVESFIVRGDYKYGDDLKFYAACSNNKETDVVYNSSIMINKTSVRKESLRLSTEEEKQQLFEALAKEGKHWDAEKKQIVDLKLKFDELKPFDKVVVRCGKADKWSIDFFSYKVSNGYICTGDAWFGYCLPYNEETAKLVGTTNNVED